MAGAALLNFFYLYASLRHYEAVLRAAGFQPWVGHPFFIRITPGHLLALASPPSLGNIILTSLMAVFIVMGISILFAVLLAKAVPRGLAALLLLLAAAIPLDLVANDRVLASPPPLLAVELDANQIALPYDPPVALNNIADFCLYSGGGKSGLEIGINTHDGRKLYAFTILRNLVGDDMGEARYVVQTLQNFITSRGHDFPAR